MKVILITTMFSSTMFAKEKAQCLINEFRTWASDKNFLDVLIENYEAAKRMPKSDLTRESITETYEDLIEIYKANYLDKKRGKIT